MNVPPCSASFAWYTLIARVSAIVDELFEKLFAKANETKWVSQGSSSSSINNYVASP
jgi:hypothetical protein